MWKLLVLSVILMSIVSEDVPNNSSLLTQKSNTPNSTNSTQPETKKQAEISSNAVISENDDHKSNKNGVENNVGKGEVKLIDSQSNEETSIEDVDDTENFKYYWVLLVFSSLSIIGIIVFKSFRLRKTRAEIKYGKPKDSDEIEPLGKSKWDDVDSSENEDEIFDINFLKNTRLNPPSDV